MQRYRFTFTVSEHGTVPENGETFLAGFIAVHPEVGPVVSQNTDSGTLSVTFSLEAEDINLAVEKAITIFMNGATESELEPTEVIDLSASLAAAEHYEGDRELQPA